MFDLHYSQESWDEARAEREAFPPTVSDACRQYAASVGSDDRWRDSQWILTDYDTWQRNPHYHGPDQGHPEALMEDYEPIVD